MLCLEVKAEAQGESNFQSTVGVQMIWVNEGSLKIDHPVKDEFSEIQISQGYYLAQTEVTKKQWYAVMGTHPPDFYQVDFPAIHVNWKEAMEYCRRLTKRDHAAGVLPPDYVYTLPTEAQWEYACRAGSTGDFSGSLDDLAWYNRNSGDQTRPVRTKMANAWGFHDMHGNVWEWCANTYLEGRALRGGGWHYPPSYCRSGYRQWGPETYENFNLGFRPAAVLAATRMTDTGLYERMVQWIKETFTGSDK